jgi:hypothetical protein
LSQFEPVKAILPPFYCYYLLLFPGRLALGFSRSCRQPVGRGKDQSTANRFGRDQLPTICAPALFFTIATGFFVSSALFFPPLFVVATLFFESPPLLLPAIFAFKALLLLTAPVFFLGCASLLPFLVARLLLFPSSLPSCAVARPSRLLLVAGPVGFAGVASRQTHVAFFPLLFRFELSHNLCPFLFALFPSSNDCFVGASEAGNVVEPRPRAPSPSYALPVHTPPGEWCRHQFGDFALDYGHFLKFICLIELMQLRANAT